MPLRITAHIIRTTLKVATAVAVIALLLFVGLTRTQRGRDALRSQLEREFDARFGGSLRVDQLEGDLLDDIHASGVRLYDSRDRLVAEVDSVTLRPSWRRFFSRHAALGRITLVRPHVMASYDDSTGWNIVDALTRAIPDSLRPPWDASSPRVVIRDGRITTRYTGAAPAPVQAGYVFNYASADVHDVQARLTIDWRDEERMVDVSYLSAHLVAPDSFAVDEVSGQLVLDDRQVEVNRFQLHTATSHFRADASYTSPPGTSSPPRFALSMEDGEIDFDEWRRLFPVLPLHDAATFGLRVHGSPGDLVVEEVTLERERTRLHGAATVTGRPERAEVDLAFHDNIVDPRDLDALLPGRFTAWRHLGPLRLTFTGDGSLPLGGPRAEAPLAFQGHLAVEGQSGRAEGTFQLSGPPRDPHYHALFDLRRFDLGHLLRRPDLASDVSGHFRLEGRGLTAATAHGRLTASLDDAWLRGVPLSGLKSTVDAEPGQWHVEALLPQQSGTWQADAVYRTDGRSLALQVDARDADLGPLLRVDTLSTRLNGSLEARVSLASAGAPPKGHIALQLDTSDIVHGPATRTLPSFASRASLSAPSPGSTRIAIEGDLLEATVEIDDELDDVSNLGLLWSRAVLRAARQAWDKPYRSDTTVTRTAGRPRPPSLPPAHAPGPTSQPLRATASLRVKRSDLLPLLLPTLPEMSLPLRARIDLLVARDTLSARGEVTADSLLLRALRADRLKGTFSLHAGAPDHLLETLEMTWTGRADSLVMNEQHLPDPELVFAYADRSTDLHLRTSAGEQPGPVRLDATLQLLEDRNRLTFQRIYLAFQGTTWDEGARQHIDLYSDAVVVPALSLTSRENGGEVQSLSVRGVISNAPQDTLFVAAQQLALHELTVLSRMPRRIGGFLGGQVAYTGGVRRPEVTGSIHIDRLAFDDRLLGTLRLTTRYLSGTPEVALHGVLLPPTAADTLLPGSEQPGRHEPSRLAIDGTFRFPELRRRRVIDPGNLDLTVNAQHVDAFFFDYIFKGLLQDSRGTITGRVGVTGTLMRPIFDARLNLADGHFVVPRYNLSFDADGRFRADTSGIHILGADLADSTGGSAHFTGSLLFNDYRYFSLDLHGVLDEIQVMNVESARELPFYGRIWASGDLYLTGPLDNAELRSPNAVTTPDSEVFIPIEEGEAYTDTGFILFADSTGRLPDVEQMTRRHSVLERPEGERRFVEGLDMRLNIQAPSGSTVRLVIDPLVGETINAVGSGRVQLLRTGGDFFTYGELTVEGGDYLFSAGELLYRRFQLDPGGTITWDGDPIDPRLDLTAFYRTRASSAGLPPSLTASAPSLIPVLVRLHVTQRVTAPQVGLQLAVDRSDRDRLGTYDGLEAFLNQPDRTAEFATSVLLTNSFLLTTALAEQSGGQTLSDTRNQFAFNSLSQLVASQLNRYLSQAIPNFDVTLGLQGQSTQDLGVTYGVALRLLDERLIIRGQGVYQNQNEQTRRAEQGIEGEFVVEVRLNPSVSVEVFYRREGDMLESDLTNTTGAGLSYETQFTSWAALFRRFFGWLLPHDEEDSAPPPDEDVVAASG